MAYKRLSISVPDYVYEQYIRGVKNQSAHIVEMFIKGSEYEIAGGISNKSQLIILSKENKSKDEQLRRQALEINRLKALTDKGDQKKAKMHRDAVLDTHRKLLMEGLD